MATGPESDAPAAWAGIVDLEDTCAVAASLELELSRRKLARRRLADNSSI